MKLLGEIATPVPPVATGLIYLFHEKNKTSETNFQKY